MSLNDTEISGSKGIDIYPGIANPTSSSNTDPMSTNFVIDPMDERHGAGAGKDFAGDKDTQRTFKQSAGVCEGRPGIVESANIDPLNEDSKKDDGWANTRATTGAYVAGDKVQQAGKEGS